MRSTTGRWRRSDATCDDRARAAMRTAPVLILPGYGDSGPDHWQSHWELAIPRSGAWRRATGSSPGSRTGWRRSSASLAECAEPPVLAAHSLACPLVAHWAGRTRLARQGGAPSRPRRRRLAASHPGRGPELQPDPARPASLPQHRGRQHRRPVRLDGALGASSRRRGAASWSRSPAPGTSTPTRATAPGPKAAACWTSSAAAERCGALPASGAAAPIDAPTRAGASTPPRRGGAWPRRRRRRAAAPASAPRRCGADAPGSIVPTMFVCRSGWVKVKRRMNSIGVMPSSRSSSRTFCHRSHCTPSCLPSVGAPLAAPPRMTIPAPARAAAAMIASCSRSTAE